VWLDAGRENTNAGNCQHPLLCLRRVSEMEARTMDNR
jgi:hypothetical protein